LLDFQEGKFLTDSPCPLYKTAATRGVLWPHTVGRTNTIPTLATVEQYVDSLTIGKGAFTRVPQVDQRG